MRIKNETSSVVFQWQPTKHISSNLNIPTITTSAALKLGRYEREKVFNNKLSFIHLLLFILLIFGVNPLEYHGGLAFKKSL
jgi:hypothetical protein